MELLKYGKVYNVNELSVFGVVGNLRKWVGRLSDGRRIYIKTSSSNGNHINYECEVECIACRVANLLGIKNVVMYDLDTFIFDNKSYKVCVSVDFVGTGSYTTINMLLPEIIRYTRIDKYNLVVESFPFIKQQLDDILLFDAIVLNSDRHLRNIGVLNGSIVPLFDNGNSMFYNKSLDYIYKILKTNLDYQPCKPFFSTYGNQVKLIDNYNLLMVSRVEVYRIVNCYFSGNRAKYINQMLVNRLERFNLLCA